METMIKKFCQRYRLPEKSLHELLSHMTEYHFGKGELIVKEGERNTNLYILKKGIWRAYYMIDGTESSLWFAGTGEIAFSSWGYVNNEISQVNIESVNESTAYYIAKPDLEELFNSSIELSNFGRKIFEQEILFIDGYTLAYGTPSAKERYLTLMEENPELLQYVPLKHLGYKSAVVNFSDIYAMNGTPKQITVSLGISKRFSIEDMEELYAGIRLACEEYDVDIVGGDTSASYTGLTISITCIGEGEKGKVVYRNGARETDLICVSGDLGAAYMGLQLLEREKAVLKGGDKDLQPDFSGKEYLLERQLKPEARRDIIQKLAEEGIQPTSMMDISDGLSSELLHICTQSKVGCRVYEEHIPIDYQTAVMAEEFNMNLSTCALNGGEDYELLFTVPIADHEKVAEMEGVKLIGHITKPELGCALITRDGQEFELKAQGWNPLKEEEAEKA